MIAESTVEESSLVWLSDLGYEIANGPDIAPGEMLAERGSYDQVVLERRLRRAVERLNPRVPAEGRDEAVRKVLRTEHPALVANNRAFHRMFIDGVTVEYPRRGGGIAGNLVRLVDFDDPANNDWLAVNQFTVVDGQNNRRPDVVIFVNGLPLGVVELKNPADEDATVWKAFQQLQTYKKQIPALFTYNEVLVASDGLEARIGSLTAPKERFMPWRTIEGQEPASARLLQLEVLFRGVFDKRRFLDLVRYGVVFDRDPHDNVIKILAGYHQFHATNAAVAATVEATRLHGDRRCGVVWHTQGSGKSLTMVFFAGRIILHPAMENPTIVVITDRNDLDGQLFDTFARCSEAIRHDPVQADSQGRSAQGCLPFPAGGVVFTTIQKFLPEEKGDRYPRLSDRRNIVVIADEAHRSQYDFIDGFARHMRDALPNASFIGFTGTPIELMDKNTRAGLRRLHQRLRYPARRRGRGHGPHLLRKPLGATGDEPGREAAPGRGLRRSHRNRRGGAQGEAQVQVGRARSRRGVGEAHRRDCPRSGGPFREAPGSHGRQGHGSVHEPPHLRGTVQGHRETAAQLAQRRRR
jgi:type I restriction enzyme R subunit